MNIVVFTRSTPDTAARIEVDDGGDVHWGDAATVVNPWDEYALEEAIAQTKSAGGSATVIAVGPELHEDALKHALAMGMNNAVRIEDEALDPTDGLAYATAAAAAVQRLEDVGLILFGKESIDVGTDQHTYMIARKLGWPVLSYVSKIIELNPDEQTIKVERTLEQGKAIVTSKLPAVISVLKDINEPRYPSFIGLRKASKAKIPVWTLTELSTEVPAGQITTHGFAALPAKDAHVEMIEGTPEEQAAKLVDRLLEEKVL